MTGEEISDQDLMLIFEAAKWAPSSRNEQPWRFIYAKRNTPHWQTFFSLIKESNQSWAKNASALIVIISKKTFSHDGTPNPHYSFDAGAAWENIALQANINGFVAHAMAGIDFQRARVALQIPGDYSVECMVAIGKQGKKEELPEVLQQREFPKERRLLKELVTEGVFRS